MSPEERAELVLAMMKPVSEVISDKWPKIEEMTHYSPPLCVEVSQAEGTTTLSVKVCEDGTIFVSGLYFQIHTSRGLNRVRYLAWRTKIDDVLTKVQREKSQVDEQVFNLLADKSQDFIRCVLSQIGLGVTLEYLVTPEQVEAFLKIKVGETCYFTMVTPDGSESAKMTKISALQAFQETTPSSSPEELFPEIKKSLITLGLRAD